MHHTVLTAIRDIVQRDVGGRGLARDPGDNLISACPGDFEAACRSVADHPAPCVGLVTGFMIPGVDPPTGETDGPLGTLFLARVLEDLGIPTVLISDAAALTALEAGRAYLGLGAKVLSMDADTASKLGPLSHLVAVERCGPSYATADLPPEHRDQNHTMRGRIITHLTAPAHRLFEAPRTYVTIGIGDGGNEIGMGKVPRSTIEKNIPNGHLIACRVPTDFLIVAGVSNWGAYAMAAGVAVLREGGNSGRFDPERERELLRHLVDFGPLVDGVTGQRAATVDGLGWDAYAEVLGQIGALLSTFR